jgi:hypothetical protein
VSARRRRGHLGVASAAIASLLGNCYEPLRTEAMLSLAERAAC